MKKYLAEFIGTMVLVIFGCGSAVAVSALLSATGIPYPAAFSTLLIAFAFGLSIVAMAYSIGNISGCHVNPAVSFGMWLSGRMSGTDCIAYIVSQILGAIAGAAILVVIFRGNSSLGTNGYGSYSTFGVTAWQALLIEFILTFVFVITVLGVTSKKEFTSTTGLVIGLALTLVHIFGVPLTGTSVNPARSIGPALLTGNWSIISQQWVFIVAPMAGAAVAALVYKVLTSEKKPAAADIEAPATPELENAAQEEINTADQAGMAPAEPCDQAQPQAAAEEPARTDDDSIAD